MDNPLYDHTNKEQIRAANPNISIWATANAGAGKTKVLIDRIARILLKGTEPEKILAVTYTKAAAAEMTNRLFQTLGRWTITKDKELGKILKKLDNDIILDSKTLSKARALFARALETPGGLKVQTIHAFCGDILKRFPIEANVAPGFEVADETLNNQIKAEAYKIAVKNKNALFANIAALTHTDQNKRLLEIAGKNLFENFVFNQDEIKKIFSNRVGIELIDDYQTFLKTQISNLPIELIKECADILNESGANDKKLAQKLLNIIYGDYEQAYDAITSLFFDSKNNLRTNISINAATKKNPAIIKFFNLESEIFPDGYLKNIYNIFNDIETSKICHCSMQLLEAASLWQNQYQKLKEEFGKLDFDDLLRITSSLLNKDEGTALWVMYKLDKGLSHILIDESQDTSSQQWDLLLPLLSTLENQTHNEVRTQFIVGDDKQSIYRFQGASPERYLKEKNRFLKHKEIEPNKYDEVNFAVSFRTGETILKTVDKIWHDGFKKEAKIDKNFLETKFYKENFDLNTQIRSHFSSRIFENSITELWPICRKSESDAIDENPWDYPIDLENNSDPQSKLAELIAREIKNRIENKLPVWGKDENDKPILRPAKPSDFMILVKSRNALFHRIIKRLKRHNIKVAGADLIILSKEAAIIDLLMAAQFALCPKDDFNTACLLKSAFCGLNDEDIFKLCNNRGNSNVIDMLNANSAFEFENAKIVLNNINKIGANKSPFEFFANLLDNKIDGKETGWQKILKRFGNEAQEPIEIILDIALNAQNFEGDNLVDFIDYIENRAGNQKREFDQNEEGVKVMTVHGAKGREAPIVILPDTTRAINNSKDNIYFDEITGFNFWAPNCKFKPEFFTKLAETEANNAISEDQRLLYVAMTRPRDRLILCGHQFRNGFAKDSWYKIFDEQLNKIDFDSELNLQSNNENEEMLTAKIWGELPQISPIEEALNIKNMLQEIPNWAADNVTHNTDIEKNLSPSLLFKDDYEIPAYSPISGNIKKRFLRGTLIHELLENLPNFSKNKWQQEANKRLSREISLNEDQKNEIINEALKILNHNEFNEIFGPNSRSEVAIIGQSDELPPNSKISGTIDRIVIKDRQILCLDYKTNRPPPENENEIPMQYIVQMACYRAILQESFPYHNIKCALLWTDSPVLMQINNDMMTMALKNLKQN